MYSLLGADRTPLVDGLSDDIHDPAQGLGAHGDPDGGAGVQDLLAADQTLGTVHGDGTHSVLTWRNHSIINRPINTGYI